MTIHLLQRPLPAVAGAALLAVGLVTIAPDPAPPAIARVEAHAVQLRAVVATEAVALLNTTDAAEAISPRAGVSAATPDLLGVAGALIDVATSFITMTLMAPISVALSPLYLRLVGPTLPSWGEIGSTCRSLVCALAAAFIALPVVGPLAKFIDSVENLRTALFPPAAPAAASASTAQSPDLPRVEPTAGTDAPASAPELVAPRSAAATTPDPVTALIDLGTNLVRAIAWIPIAAVFTPFWAAMGFPGPASALQPWEPGSDCGGPGVALRCVLRSAAYGLVAAPYVDLARSFRNLVGPERTDEVASGPRGSAVAPSVLPDGSSKPLERRKRPERAGVKPAQAAAVHAVSGTGKSSAKAGRSGSGRR